MREKIYEHLAYLPEPEGYQSQVPWIVQNQIAATNGIHYSDRIGKLNEYPSYDLPVPVTSGEKLMLDIGAGWGRWLCSGYRKGYIPVGLDIRLEFCQTQQRVLADQGYKGYSVVADLQSMPFAGQIFDLIWSFSVIQHTHRKRLVSCLKSIEFLLKTSGVTMLEFPNKNGIRNRFGPARTYSPETDTYESWDVRYYSIAEYRELFDSILKDFSFQNHSFLGIGVLKEDLKYVSLKNKFPCMISLFLSFFANHMPGLKYFSDSIYITAKKSNSAVDNPVLSRFLHLHQNTPFDNLNIWPLLTCPKYGESLSLSKDGLSLEAPRAGIRYPIENKIPILIQSEAIVL